jgi:hypothetical protein
MHSIDALVRSALANRAPREAATGGAVRLESATAGAPFEPDDDVELTPLEVVLVALDMEQATACEWPLERLASVRTVGELLAFFASEPIERPPAPVDWSGDLGEEPTWPALDLN